MVHNSLDGFTKPSILERKIMNHSIRKIVTASLLGATLSLSGFGITSVSAKDNGPQKTLNITTEQENCLVSAKANIARGPGRKASVKAAAQSCGIWGRFAKLGTAQQTCLATYGLSRPSGLPTQAHKKQLKSLAAKCGITLKVKK
jgi:hypothetical protein